MAIQGVSGMSIPLDYVLHGRGPSSAQEIRSEAAGGRSERSGSREFGPQALTSDELSQVRRLEEVDRSVRVHEQAHVAVGGDLIKGAATFTYTIGPDGRRYAVAGEVSIDTSPGRTPEETVPKAQRIRETALAPADPSPQDRRVAAKASRMEVDALRELAVLEQREAKEENSREGAGAYRDVERSGRAARVGGRLSVFA